MLPGRMLHLRIAGKVEDLPGAENAEEGDLDVREAVITAQKRFKDAEEIFANRGGILDQVEKTDEEREAEEEETRQANAALVKRGRELEIELEEHTQDEVNNTRAIFRKEVSGVIGSVGVVIESALKTTGKIAIGIIMGIVEKAAREIIKAGKAIRKEWQKE